LTETLKSAQGGTKAFVRETSQSENAQPLSLGLALAFDSL